MIFDPQLPMSHHFGHISYAKLYVDMIIEYFKFAWFPIKFGGKISMIWCEFGSDLPCVFFFKIFPILGPLCNFDGTLYLVQIKKCMTVFFTFLSLRP